MDAVGPKVVAEWLALSTRSVSELAEKGQAIRLGHGKYDLKATVQRYASHMREVAAARGGEAQILDLTAERARLAKEQADAQELKNAVSRKELLPAGDVEREWADVLLRIRSAILSVPARLRPHMSLSVTDAALLDRELRDALEALADDDDNAPKGAGEAEAAAED